jgi:hypothetical protein
VYKTGLLLGISSSAFFPPNNERRQLHRHPFSTGGQMIFLALLENGLSNHSFRLESLTTGLVLLVDVEDGGTGGFQEAKGALIL